MTAGGVRPCTAPGCAAPGERYPSGTLCDTHAPWAAAGREDPRLQVARVRSTWPDSWKKRHEPPPLPVARKTDPRTSHAAARSVRGVSDTRQRILDLLDLVGPCTDEQIAEAYEARVRAGAWPPCSPSGLRTRRAELVDLGAVRDSGRTRLTAAGRRTTVWTAA